MSVVALFEAALESPGVPPSLADTAADGDRLPWLADEPVPSPRRNWETLIGWLVAAMLLLLASAYWLVGRPSLEGERRDTHRLPQQTLVLPPVRPVANSPRAAEATSIVPNIPLQIKISPQAEVVPPEPPSAAPQPPPIAAAPRTPAPSAPAPGVKLASQTEHSAPRPTRSIPILPTAPPTFTRSAGGIVHVGAFADIDQATTVWKTMVQASPGVDQTQALLIRNRDWNGQPFYQFQIATASREDSQNLCRSMTRFGIRCEIVQIP